MSIEEFINKRAIKSLYHFTALGNLQSILDNGLLSVTSLQENNIGYYYNDELRLEKKLNAICVSISFPNYKMFYKYRKKYDELQWCVIELDPSILYEKKCLFCETNAANSNEISKNDYEKNDINALNKLFYDDKYMKDQGLDLNIPTDPQAEVLVLNNIEPQYIKSLNFEVREINFPISKYSNFKFLYNTDLFWCRKDWRNWQN